MNTNPCVPACSSTPAVVNYPGPSGATGTAGANAFTTTTNSFVIPAVAATVTVPVVSSAFMATGQYLYITDGTSKSIFQVTTISSLTSVILTYINDPINTQTGNTMASNAAVTPAGFNGSAITPVAVANGGTGSTTKAGAQLALGLGQSATVSTVAGLTQAITATPAQIGTIAAICPASSAGKYLIGGYFSVDWAGVTFSASRVITGKIRNVTSGTDYTSVAIDTQILTTTTLPTSHFYIPYSVQTLAAGDSIQILVSISVINSAGTLTTTTASVAIVPLALT